MYVISDVGSPPANEIWFRETEWKHVQKLLASHQHDPETQKEFFLTVIEKKKIDSSYNIFLDFPPSSGLEICNEVIKMLRREK